MKKRLFIGIRIMPSYELLDFYSKLKQNLLLDKIKWVSAENFHITLKFLGEIETSLIPEIKKSVQTVANQTRKFKIQLKGLGQFKKNRSTKVIWLGLSNFEKINNLAENVMLEMIGLGFEPENRPYSAHLTIGRVKYVDDEIKLTEMIENFKDEMFQLSDIESITLYESISSLKGLVYIPLYIVDLLK
ncbi:MAG: RNA 2',3'-cyclic phosphodiesterase [Bacteroidales bacterium]|nr:RNA 2',3'-cyclic phosphodiesterase [Bacteroidales bacterium]